MMPERQHLLITLQLLGRCYKHVVDPAAHHGPGDFQDDWRRGVVTGYHLGFRSLADENRELLVQATFL